MLSTRLAGVTPSGIRDCSATLPDDRRRSLAATSPSPHKSLHTGSLWTRVLHETYRVIDFIRYLFRIRSSVPPYLSLDNFKLVIRLRVRKIGLGKNMIDLGMDSQWTTQLRMEMFHHSPSLLESGLRPNTSTTHHPTQRHQENSPFFCLARSKSGRFASAGGAFSHVGISWYFSVC